jgi:cation transport ATPase
MGELRLHVHGMDCAEEAALIRRALQPTPGVTGLDFDLIHGFVHVGFDESHTSAAAIADIVRGTGLQVHAIAATGEADESLHTYEHHHPRGEYSTAWTAGSGTLFVLGWAVEGFAADHWLEAFVGHAHDPRAVAFYAASALTGLWPMWPRALASIRYLRLDMHVLVCLSVLGAAAIGEWSEGAAVAFLFALAHRMEAWSIERARTEIAALTDRSAAAVATAIHDTANVERWIERFAAIYTPAVTATALVVALTPPLIDGQWALWLYRGLVFLVLGCPCALVISTPVTVIAALSSAARRGVLIRGGAALERAAVDPAVAVTRGDVVLATADRDAMGFLGAHARRALRVIRQNVAIALLTKVGFLIAAPFGVAALWMAVLADTGATVIVTLNALRLLRATERLGPPHRS